MRVVGVLYTTKILYDHAHTRPLAARTQQQLVVVVVKCVPSRQPGFGCRRALVPRLHGWAGRPTLRPFPLCVSAWAPGLLCVPPKRWRARCSALARRLAAWPPESTWRDCAYATAAAKRAHGQQPARQPARQPASPPASTHGLGPVRPSALTIVCFRLSSARAHVGPRRTLANRTPRRRDRRARAVPGRGRREHVAGCA